MPTKPKPIAPAPRPAPVDLMALAGSGPEATQPPVPDERALRAQRLLSGAFYSALLNGKCDCGTCRRLRKVAALTQALTEEDLEDE